MRGDALEKLPLSDHFRAGEFRCQGGSCSCHGAISVDQRLVDLLEELRAELGSPIVITSAFRCDDHNETVGGHPKSFHRTGQAADLTSFRIRSDLENWAIIFAKIVEGRLGQERGNVIWYPKRNFIHVDVGRRISELLREKS